MTDTIGKQISQAILGDVNNLSEKIMQQHYRLSPELLEQFDQRQRDLSLKDSSYNLSYLAQAIELDSIQLFSSYAKWLQKLLASKGLSSDLLVQNFSVLEAVLEEELNPDYVSQIKIFVSAAQRALQSSSIEDQSFIQPNNPAYITASLFLDLILQGRRYEASKLIMGMVNDKDSIISIYLDVLQPVQREIGNLWQSGKISVAQEHYCTGITQLVISQLYPYIFTPETKNKTMVATCVSGELHEIGLRMVSDIFELEGWNTWYLGANMPTEAVVQTILEKEADLIAISATMTFHLGQLEKLIQAIRQNGVSKPIMVGGYPFLIDALLWQKVGAEASAKDAAEALQIANKLVAI